jgi:hypothetical protein
MEISISKKIISAYINNSIPTRHLSNKKLTNWSNIIFYDWTWNYMCIIYHTLVLLQDIIALFCYSYVFRIEITSDPRTYSINIRAAIACVNIRNCMLICFIKYENGCGNETIQSSSDQFPPLLLTSFDRKLGIFKQKLCFHRPPFPKHFKIWSVPPRVARG